MDPGAKATGAHMIAAILLALALNTSVEMDEATLLASAQSSFQDGVTLRQDATKAKPKFAEAAASFDNLWRRGCHTPELALSRAKAHALAGNLPMAIVAVHAGLWIVPYHAELLAMLETCRNQVVNVPPTKAEETIRAPRLQGLRHRLSDWDLYLLSIVSSLLVAIGLSRRFTTQDQWAIPLAIVGGISLLLIYAAHWQIEREHNRDADHPLLIVRTAMPLRTGNGETYLKRMEAILPAGAEVRERARRGDWLQVEIFGGILGWIPEAASIRVETPSASTSPK